MPVGSRGVLLVSSQLLPRVVGLDMGLLGFKRPRGPLKGQSKRETSLRHLYECHVNGVALLPQYNQI